MQLKTIKKNISKKMTEWIATITDKDLANDLGSNILVSGGSIASMLLGEPVNDYDVYIKDIDVLKRLVKYYVKPYHLEIFDGREKAEIIKEFDDLLDDTGWDKNMKYHAVNSLRSDQIKIFTTGKKIEENQGNDVKPYLVSFISPNAISLTGDVQIVNRFHGNAERIHKTFDFIHATNYFTFEEGLVTNKAALESLITKRLMYQGSLYPLTSIIRANKFVKRGWNIGAGEYLKIMFQISELDLKDPDVLDEQLIGVDVAYFSTLIRMMRADPKPVTHEYLSALIDRVFND